jgi:regulatory protein
MEEAGKAKKAALRLLAFRPRSESELRRRLAAKKLSKADIDRVVGELRSEKALDDERFAKLYASSRMQSRSFGKARVRMELAQKGLALPQVERAMAFIADFDETGMARDLVKNRLAVMKGLTPEAKKRRLHGLLSRRGFSSATVFKVLGEFLGPTEEE